MTKVTAYFSNVFGQSPFAPLQEHARLCVQATEHLSALITHSHVCEHEEMAALYDEVTRSEHAADDLKQQIRANLPRGFLMPVARADILDLLGRQDEIANLARDISGLMVGRNMQFPEIVRDSLDELVQAATQSCAIVADIVSDLDELIDAGFRGREAELVQAKVAQVDELEHTTDELVISIRATMMGIEDELKPIQAIFQYRTLDMIGGLADAAERVAHRVQLMLA